ncbi:DUF986 family protein [Xenorhabdus szentirmaii]|uniref:UPF0266 membrane protein XSR1_10340 n=1 Tax=Xenorhabdus szentirmaii DSM 16338 TaxID=1427518 RepID=W1ISX7_9GAMM|nr:MULTISPECIES: DUF986 family protein [Xenorhabdus]MBD2779777.1 DUF986 domain-containing protein [Xenorhabdus sp. 38]MBD2793451.1 DUF986 domain-containing protein [Xenorhabdus sp. CUL]MBD2819540.1 DUF986 domain-containing protein [Xenorhabdus sp. 42]MBD2826242.1 DUF986 domain-containing protein [Xenorhabdus sp. 5]PHM32311.1 hypothetical protein Xsze_03047 [Xenorhabdus szentirmaii DSM 16338]
MSLNNSLLIGLIMIMLAFTIYDKFIINQLKGKTLLNVKLKKKHRIDALIFIILIVIIIHNNVTSQGSLLFTCLLSFTLLVTLYLGYIRSPKLLFKKEGFYYMNRFFSYEKMTAMDLSEDAILRVSFGEHKIYISVTNLDDLEKIYQFLVNNK